MGKVLIPH
jgi:uncharacterized protein (DUF362 family)